LLHLKTQRTERHELDAMASPSDGEDEGAETPADQADHRAQCVCGIEVELVVLYKTKQRIHSTRRSPPLRAYLARAASKYQYLRQPVSSAPRPPPRALAMRPPVDAVCLPSRFRHVGKGARCGRIAAEPVLELCDLRLRQLADQWLNAIDAPSLPRFEHAGR